MQVEKEPQPEPKRWCVLVIIDDIKSPVYGSWGFWDDKKEAELWLKGEVAQGCIRLLVQGFLKRNPHLTVLSSSVDARMAVYQLQNIPLHIPVPINPKLPATVQLVHDATPQPSVDGWRI